MIKPITQKVFFVDNEFLCELKEASIAKYEYFQQPSLDTQIINLSIIDENAINKLHLLMDVEHIRPGNVLVKTQYSNQFSPIDCFDEDVTLKKFMLWQLLCMALGAKQVSVNSVESILIDSDSSAEYSAYAELKMPVGSGVIGGNYSARSSTENLKKKMMEMKAKATGSLPDLTAADEILTKNGLIRDDLFRSIRDMRSFPSNQLIQQHFTLDMTKDVKKMFDSSMTAKLGVVAQFYKARFDVSAIEKSLEKSKEAIKVTVSVDF